VSSATPPKHCIILLTAALGLAGCQASPPSTAASPFVARFPAAAFGSLPLPPPAPPKPPPLTSPRPAASNPAPLPQPTAVSADWSFASDAGVCTAAAAADSAGFSIAVQAGHPVVFTVFAARPALAAGARAAIRLSGAAGSRTLAGRAVNGARIEADVPPGNEALDYILAALGGGTADAAGLARIRMPPAGPEGASWWFGCAEARARP